MPKLGKLLVEWRVHSVRRNSHQWFIEWRRIYACRSSSWKCFNVYRHGQLWINRLFFLSYPYFEWKVSRRRFLHYSILKRLLIFILFVIISRWESIQNVPSNLYLVTFPAINYKGWVESNMDKFRELVFQSPTKQHNFKPSELDWLAFNTRSPTDIAEFFITKLNSLQIASTGIRDYERQRRFTRKLLDI